MKHKNTLFIVTSVSEDIKIYNFDNRFQSQNFNVVLIIKTEKNNSPNFYPFVESLKQKYKDNGIEVHSALYVISKTPIDILKELASTNQILDLQSSAVDHKNSYVYFWFDNVFGWTNEINSTFQCAQDNNWKYIHAGTEHITHSDLFFLNWNSYLEYEKYSNDGTPYVHAFFIPLIAPVYHYSLWCEINRILNVYPYKSEQAFTRFWIPELLSYQSELIHPIVIHKDSIDIFDKRKSKKEEDYKEAKLACYSTVSSLYKKEDAIEIYCISLSDSFSRERQKQFQAAAIEHELEFEFWEAVDGRQWTRADYPSCIAHRGRRVDWHEPLKPGEVGTIVSHYQLMEYAWNEGLSGLVVFEDDAVLLRPLDAIQIPEDADFLMLNSRFKHNNRGECVIGSCGTEAYIITRRGIYKILQIYKHINMPIDLLILAHANSIIKSKVHLSTVRNKLNPTLNVYHNKVYTENKDQGISTFLR
jgi:GR25 family glycosyltransferase involved in LPS biosynthesis